MLAYGSRCTHNLLHMAVCQDRDLDLYAESRVIQWISTVESAKRREVRMRKDRMQSHVGRVEESDQRFYRLVRQPTLVPRNNGAGEWRGCITSSLFAHAPCRIRCLCAFADDRAARATH